MSKVKIPEAKRSKIENRVEKAGSRKDPIHQGKIGLILKEARETLDLSPEMLLGEATKMGCTVVTPKKLSKIEGQTIAANTGQLISSSDFCILCRLLCISLNSYTIGYSKYAQLMEVQKRIDENTFPFDVSAALNRKLGIRTISTTKIPFIDNDLEII